MSYNYGMFRLPQENSSSAASCQGGMWVLDAGGREASATWSLYTRADRRVVQQLAMTPAQKEAPASRASCVETTRATSIRDYHYDYYRDNCSTRVRDALGPARWARAIRGPVRHPSSRRPAIAGTTARLTSGSPLLYSGLMRWTGTPPTGPSPRGSRMFLPVHLSRNLRELTVPDSAAERPARCHGAAAVHQSTRYPEPEAPRRLVFPFLVLGVLLGSLLWITAHRRGSRRRHADVRGRWAVLWSVVAGLGGIRAASACGSSPTTWATARGQLRSVLPSRRCPLALVVLLRSRAVVRGGRVRP